MKKIATKMALMAMTTGLGFSIPTAAAGASMTSYSYDFSAATSLPGGPFAGSFTLQVASGVWSLTAFSGSLNGYTYDLGNVGLDSNRNPSLLYIGGKADGPLSINANTDDFVMVLYKQELGQPNKLTTQMNITEAGSYAVDTYRSTVLVPVTSAIPEPASWAMMIAGMGAIGFAMRRKTKLQPRLAG